MATCDSIRLQRTAAAKIQARDTCASFVRRSSAISAAQTKLNIIFVGNTGGVVLDQSEKLPRDEALLGRSRAFNGVDLGQVKAQLKALKDQIDPQQQ